MILMINILFYHAQRATNDNIQDEESTDSSDEEESDNDISENSDYETECYESYTRKNHTKVTLCNIFVYSSIKVNFFNHTNHMQSCDPIFIYVGFRNAKEKKHEPVLEGVDWESVNYQLHKLPCEEDEITGNVQYDYNF